MTSTIHDVARKAGVGIGTVSRVLNNSGSVNKETRNRILEVIAELDYTPHLAARRLSSGKTLVIGAIIPFFTRPAAVERLRGVMSIIAATNYDFNLFSIETPLQRQDYLQTVPRPGRIDGLIIFSFPTTPAETERIITSKIPTIIIDSFNSTLDCIYVDNVKGGYAATQHLIKLGHTKIGYLGDPLEDPIGFFVSRDRFKGYRQALEEAGIPFNPRFHREGPHSIESARLMALDLLTQPDPPTALFAFSDTITLGIIDAARELKLFVPGDLSVIGFDDIEIARFAGLSTVRQQLFETGVMGAKMLLNRLDEPEQEHTAVLLPTELVMRQTTAKFVG